MLSAIVTGASGGMGSATCRRFLESGFKVFGLDLADSQIDHAKYHHFRGSITDEHFLTSVRNEIGESLSSVNALVNIAGINYFELIEATSLAEWRKMFDVNVLGMVATIKHFTPLLRQSNDASIVNMSSISAGIGSVGYAAYCATKGAVDSLTKSLALELAPKIRVNAVAPGWIETEFTLSGLNMSSDPAAYRREVEAMHALERVGRPEEIANGIFWLCSPQASFITGSVVVMDGGYLVK